MDPYDLSKRSDDFHTWPHPPKRDPDRAARIRARAERLLDAAWLAAPGMASGALTKHDKTVEGAFVLARFEIDELDRLEREEREIERRSPEPTTAGTQRGTT